MKDVSGVRIIHKDEFIADLTLIIQSLIHKLFSTDTSLELIQGARLDSKIRYKFIIDQKTILARIYLPYAFLEYDNSLYLFVDNKSVYNEYGFEKERIILDLISNSDIITPDILYSFDEIEEHITDQAQKIGLFQDMKVQIITWIDGEPQPHGLNSNFLIDTVTFLQNSYRKIDAEGKPEYFLFFKHLLSGHLQKLDFEVDNSDTQQLFLNYRSKLPEIMKLIDHAHHNITLLHGDLHNGNIVTGEHSIGIIDWEYASIGPIEFDIIYYLLSNYIFTNKIYLVRDLTQLLIELQNTLREFDVQIDDTSFVGNIINNLGNDEHYLTNWVHIILYLFCHWTLWDLSKLVFIYKKYGLHDLETEINDIKKSFSHLISFI